MPRSKSGKLVNSNSTRYGFIGYGTLGQMVASALSQQLGQYEKAIFDDDLYNDQIVDCYPFNGYQEDVFSNYSFFVCLGYQLLNKKLEILNQLENEGKKVLNYIHPTAYLDSMSMIGLGAIIHPGVIIERASRIGDGVIINSSTTVSHDSQIGDCTFLAPGVIICGNVKIGRLCFIGAGSVISNSINVADRCQIGIGTVVTEDLTEASYVIGNPMQRLKKPLRMR